MDILVMVGFTVYYLYFREPNDATRLYPDGFDEPWEAFDAMLEDASEKEENKPFVLGHKYFVT